MAVSTGYAVPNVSDLTAITDLTDGYLLFCKEKNVWYRYSAASTATVDGDNVVAAAGGVGRWLKTSKEILAATRTYYVSTTGSNSNNGLTVGTPFLTVQKAVDVASSCENGGYDISIQVVDGTYNEGVTLRNFSGAGKIIIKGNVVTPANVVINATASAALTTSNCIYSEGVFGTYRISSLKLQSTNGHGIFAKDRARVEIDAVNFGSCGVAHMRSELNSVIQAITGYTISGGASNSHAWANLGGAVNVETVTVTLTGTPAFAVFVNSNYAGIVNFFNVTFSGSATGLKFQVNTNAIVNTSTGNINYFPGSGAGTTGTGGIYA